MRNIQKGDEPPSLTQHKKTPHAEYDNYNDKDQLRQNLANEQRGVCCYCLSRIRPRRTGMKIEHWRCRENHPELQLEYSNLLGACLGGHGRPGKEQHCDTYKGNADLSINPADPTCNVERLVKYSGRGRIESGDPAVDRQLNEVLNLNHPHLVANRKSVLDSFFQFLEKVHVNDGLLNRELRKWRGDDGGELHEFSQVVVYYLCRRLKVAL